MADMTINMGWNSGKNLREKILEFQSEMYGETPGELPSVSAGVYPETMTCAIRAGQFCNVPVKDLVAGDVIQAASGAQRSVRRVEHRIVDCRQHSIPENVLPLRIAANAFGFGKPRRDLYVSPGQAICIDVLGEVLIPASRLVNGSTIVRVSADCVTFWSVELDIHDILLAENLPLDSNLDHSGLARASRGDDPAPGSTRPRSPSADPALSRPLLVSGHIVDFVHARLWQRAIALDRKPMKQLASYVHDVPSSSFAAYFARTR